MFGHLSVQCLLVSCVFGVGGAAKSVRNHMAVTVDALGNTFPEEEPCDDSLEPSPGIIRNDKKGEGANQSQEDEDADSFFKGLLVQHSLALWNLTNYTTMVRTSPGAAKNPMVFHKIGLNLTADIDLLHSQVEGLFEFLKPSPWVPSSIAEKCLHGDFRNFARCLSSAVCLLQKGVTMHAISNEAFALLHELTTRYLDGSHSVLVHWVGHVTESPSEQHDQDHNCEWVSMEHKAPKGLNQSVSDVDKALDNVHDNVKSMVDKEDGRYDLFHGAVEELCAHTGCDHAVYHEVYAASHTHTMKLIESGADVQTVKKDLQRRANMDKLVKKFLSNHGDEALITKWLGKDGMEGKAAEQIEQYYRRLRAALQDHVRDLVRKGAQAPSLAEQGSDLARWGWLNKVVHSVSHAATSVVHTVSHAAQDVGHAVGSAAQTVGHAVSSAAQTVGHAVASAATDVLHWTEHVFACMGHVSLFTKAGYKWSIYDPQFGNLGVAFSVTLQASIPPLLKDVWTSIVSRRSVDDMSFTVKATAGVVLGVGVKIAGLAAANLGVGCTTAITYAHQAGQPSALTLSLTLGEMGSVGISSPDCPFGNYLGPAKCMIAAQETISIMCCKINFFTGHHDCR